MTDSARNNRISKDTRLLSAKEFAKMQGWTPYQVYYRVREFNLPHVYIGKKIFIPADWVERLLAQQEEER